MEKQQALQYVLMERTIKQRLPRVVEMKEKVDAGHLLNEMEINYLEQIISDINKNQHLAAENEELQKIVAQIIHLYSQVVAKAFENESR